MLLPEFITILRDIGVLFFGVTGALFAYRAWRQKHDEIKEKYFERRYDLYTTVFTSARQGLQSTNTFEWWQPLWGAAERAEFLVGSEAAKCIRDIHDLLTEHQNKVDNIDVNVRLSSKIERAAIDTALKTFRSLMEPYLRVGILR